MRIDLLWFPDCPNRELAKARLHTALDVERMTADVTEIEVDDPARAREVRFLGSPTIRIDDIDVEPSARAATAFGLMCRTYRTEEGVEGAPSIEMIRAALRARYGESRAVPIACSLSPREARERIARWNDLVMDAQLSARTQRGSVRAEFRSDAAVRAELAALVAAERECCPFLHFDVVRTKSAVTLTVTALNADATEDLTMLAPNLGIA